MDKPIVVTVPHSLGAEAAKIRVSKGLERLRSDLNKLAHTEVNWSGDRADVRISALGQTLTAQLDVHDDSLRIEARFLGILSGLMSKLSDGLISNVKGSLQLERAPPKS
jgi:hypothetical protein